MNLLLELDLLLHMEFQFLIRSVMLLMRPFVSHVFVDFAIFRR